MDMEKIQREQDIEQWHEKDRLFQLDEIELSRQPIEVRYQRLRYVREIEAHEFSGMLKYMPRDRAITEARKKAEWVVDNWNTIKKHPDTWSKEVCPITWNQKKIVSHADQSATKLDT